jgi:hypothetical protein
MCAVALGRLSARQLLGRRHELAERAHLTHLMGRLNGTQGGRVTEANFNTVAAFPVESECCPPTSPAATLEAMCVAMCAVLRTGGWGA